MNTTPTDHYQTAVSLTDNAGGMTAADGRALVTAVRGLAHAILAARPAPEPADAPDDLGPAATLDGIHAIANILVRNHVVGLLVAVDAAEVLWKAGYRPTWAAPQAAGL